MARTRRKRPLAEKFRTAVIRADRREITLPALRDEKRLLRLQRQLAKVKLLIIDELGFVPLSKTGAELLFELISQRYERGSTLITSNLPFEEWTETFGTERLTGALLDRLTHHVNILEMNGESYRLNQNRSRRKSSKQ
jgi:DNA replication protein DnaC